MCSSHWIHNSFWFVKQIPYEEVMPFWSFWRTQKNVVGVGPTSCHLSAQLALAWKVGPTTSWHGKKKSMWHHCQHYINTPLATLLVPCGTTWMNEKVPCGPTKWFHVAPRWLTIGSKYIQPTPNGIWTLDLSIDNTMSYHQGTMYLL